MLSRNELGNGLNDSLVFKENQSLAKSGYVHEKEKSFA